jgi:hypothetical protein
MKTNLLLTSMIAILLVVICGCQSHNQPNAKSTDAIELEAFYPGDMTQVDTIEMMSGSNGNRKTITNPTKIREWIEKVRHLKMIPDPDQEQSTGVLFHVSLFEKGKKTLNLTPTTVDHKPVKPNSDLAELMKQLYESGE